jgi:hypothetical protein
MIGQQERKKVMIYRAYSDAPREPQTLGSKFGGYAVQESRDDERVTIEVLVNAKRQYRAYAYVWRYCQDVSQEGVIADIWADGADRDEALQKLAAKAAALKPKDSLALLRIARSFGAT